MRRGLIKSLTPIWVRQIVDVEAGKDVKVIWYSYKTGYRGHGSGDPWHRRIKCHADDYRTRASVCLVLHEITHINTPISEIQNKSRWAWHGPEFIKRVIPLYEKYDVLEYAAKWEHYKRIRSAIERYMLMNKYKNAGGIEQTLFQIICPVCKIKDVTENKATWVCPNCKDSKQEVIKVQTKPVEQVEDSFMAALQAVTGIKPAEPAKVVREFTVNGLQCKVVSTKRK